MIKCDELSSKFHQLYRSIRICDVVMLLLIYVILKRHVNYINDTFI